MTAAQKPKVPGDASPGQSLTQRLTGICRRPVDDATRRKAALHLIDWLGCAAAGLSTPAGAVLSRHATGRNPGGCPALGLNQDLEAAAAAFFMGGLGNTLEMDDIHRSSILHPGPVVIPAALGAASETGASGTQLLDAIVRGYEAVIRVGSAVGPGHYANWHNTATCGPFGAAMAAADLLNLSDGPTVDALGNAGTLAGGLWRVRHEPVMSKQLHNARAAEAGLTSAQLAALGFTGPAFILEGDQGFFAAMCTDAMPNRVAADPNNPWLIWDTSVKPWPACRHAHAAIDAALALHEGGINTEAVERIEIHSYGDAVLFCNKMAPKQVIEGKFSLQHCVAITLLCGEPGLEDFEPPALVRPEVAALRQRSVVEVEPVFDTAYPERYGASVSVTLKSGRVLDQSISDALGDPDNPLPEEKLIEKARMLMSAAKTPQSVISNVIDSALDLAEGGESSTLLGLLPGISTGAMK